jgi:hypothetical protein
MGQNWSDTLQYTNIGVRQLISELPDYEYERILGSTPLLKTVSCNHPNGKQIIKVYIKNTSQDLGNYQRSLLSWIELT